MANKMERFTQRARRVLSLAQEEAERLQHNTIGTEHMLLGLMREEGGVARYVLRDLGLEQRRVEELVERMTRATTRTETTNLDLSPGTKRILELAVDEARRMGHHYIGTEHLLLGLVRQSEGVAIDVLKRLGVSPDEVRRQTNRVLQESSVEPDIDPPKTARYPIKEPAVPLEHIRRAQSAQKETSELLAKIGTGVHTRLLFRFLLALSQTLNSEEKAQMRQMVEDEFSAVLSQQNVFLSEDERSRLLDPLIAPFKLSNQSRRTLHLVVSDATSGEIYADLNLPMNQIREALEAFIQALSAGSTGKLLNITDDQNNTLEVSVDDAPEESAE